MMLGEDLPLQQCVPQLPQQHVPAHLLKTPDAMQVDPSALEGLIFPLSTKQARYNVVIEENSAVRVDKSEGTNTSNLIL